MSGPQTILIEHEVEIKVKDTDGREIEATVEMGAGTNAGDDVTITIATTELLTIGIDINGTMIECDIDSIDRAEQMAVIDFDELKVAIQQTDYEITNDKIPNTVQLGEQEIEVTVKAGQVLLDETALRFSKWATDLYAEAFTRGQLSVLAEAEANLNRIHSEVKRMARAQAKFIGPSGT